MRRFVPEDLAEINSWYRARALPAIPRDAVPEIGYLEPKVAAGFIYRTDAPGISFLDGFVTCPGAPRRARHQAVKEILVLLEAEARGQGISRVVGITDRRSMARIVESLGFRTIGLYEMLRKEV